MVHVTVLTFCCIKRIIWKSQRNSLNFKIPITGIFVSLSKVKVKRYGSFTLDSHRGRLTFIYEGRK